MGKSEATNMFVCLKTGRQCRESGKWTAVAQAGVLRTVARGSS